MYEQQLGKSDGRSGVALKDWITEQNAPRIPELSYQDRTAELMHAQTGLLRSIRNMLRFFVVLACAAILGGLLMVLSKL